MNALEVLVAADDRYAMAMTVTAVSAVLACAESGRGLTLHVFDVGISPENRKRAEASLDLPGVEVHWVEGLEDKVAGLPEIWWFTAAIHARMFAPELLPDTPRLIYLDCDIVVNHDLGELFDTDLEGCVCGAVPDMQDPFVSSPQGVPFWFDQQRRPGDLNYNSGMLLMDLDAWRRDRVAEAALECMRNAPDGVVMLNQNSLNTVAGQRFKPLDPRWNQQSELFIGMPHYASKLPYPKEEVDRLKVDPWIIHFANLEKPWHAGFEHPFADRWFECLDRTDWVGWRPEAAPTPNHVQRTTRRMARVARNAARRAKIV